MYIILITIKAEWQNRTDNSIKLLNNLEQSKSTESIIMSSYDIAMFSVVFDYFVDIIFCSLVKKLENSMQGSSWDLYTSNKQNKQ